MTEPVKSPVNANSEDTSLPVLVTRLGEDVLRLVDTKLSLLKIEIQEDLWAYGSNLVALSVAAIVGAVGFALVNVAFAFLVAHLLRSTNMSEAMQHAFGFAATGLVYLAVGTTIAIRSWHRLTERHSAAAKTLTVPETGR